MRKPGNSWESMVYQQLKKCSRVTISLWNASKTGRIPIAFACKTFGIDGIEHVNAIKWCIDNKKILPLDLENSKKSGIKMQKIICISENPVKVKFETIFDIIGDK